MLFLKKTFCVCALLITMWQRTGGRVPTAERLRDAACVGEAEARAVGSYPDAGEYRDVVAQFRWRAFNVFWLPCQVVPSWLVFCFCLYYAGG